MEEAADLLRLHGDASKVLAGGQSLVPLLNMRLAQPEVLIDLNRIPNLDYVREVHRAGIPGVELGSMVRQRSIERNEALAQRIPVLREAVGWVGHSQIRNRGTIGGSIAHADPAAELPLVFRTLNGVATLRSHTGSRAVSASDFFLSTLTTAIQADEILVDIWLPVTSGKTGQAFLEVARRHGDFALVAVAASLTLDERGNCSDVRVAIGGAAPVPMRAFAAEELITGARPSSQLFREASELTKNAIEPTGDVHADGEYRLEVAGVLTYRALSKAFERIPKDDA